MESQFKTKYTYNNLTFTALIITAADKFFIYLFIFFFFVFFRDNKA